jgi:hypothetical protein
METNKLAKYAIQEPILGAFILKKILPFIDGHTLRECIKQFSDEDCEEFVNILIEMGFNENKIIEILK